MRSTARRFEATWLPCSPTSKRNYCRWRVDGIHEIPKVVLQRHVVVVIVRGADGVGMYVSELDPTTCGTSP
jgi:hypothetical protein